MVELISVVGISGLSLVGVSLLLFGYSMMRIKKSQVLLSKSVNRWKNTKREIENERREAFLKVKDEIYKRRNEFELEIKRERFELERLKNKINSKYETLEQKEESMEHSKLELQQKERELSRLSDKIRIDESKLKSVYNELISKLEAISGMTKDEAKKALFDSLDSEVRFANEKWIQKVEEEARQLAKQKAIDIVIGAMQRYTTEQVSPHSSCVVHLPNDDMKGRIIGKEGRNIKALELSTGMEFVIGETPEIITISGFNPIRREIAKQALDRLIADGRINPTRIEETVARCEKEINETIDEIGKGVVLEFNLQGVHKDLVTMLGKLHFRTSFSQNVLEHSKEVGSLARMIAEELGLDGDVALRAGLLHDVGKAVSEEVEGPHAIVGGDAAKRCGERSEIVNAIAAHHEEIPFASFYAPIVLIADSISASRPGARRETLAAYLKRLERLEEIANTFDGIKKAYALQAGREIRIIVEENTVNDEKAQELARNIAIKVEEELSFPGQIKVNVIREKRSIEYAR
ncbi:ribonuclease Y [bacterium]|jgi:ribonucrease Y|nr:ribonuclease Y [bacterium]